MSIENDFIDRNKRKRRNWLIGCISAALITICITVFLLVGGYAGIKTLLANRDEEIDVRVVSPSSSVMAGEDFQIEIVIINNGKRNINITGIDLPVELVSAALVTRVTPDGSSQLGELGLTSYGYDLLIAPDGEETIIFDLTALEERDIQGNITVKTEFTTTSSGFRVFISPLVVVEETEDPSPAEETQEIEEMMGNLIPYQSVVQITAIVDVNDELYEGWAGSGTIISAEGLILTNAHVVLSDRVYDVVELVVAITMEQDEPPVAMFLADVVQADEYLDLAVIKIRSKIDGSDADFASLEIDPVPIGEADSLQLGDSIIIIGYPGIGGDTITLTRGEVSGFTPQSPYGNRAFIKTSATIAGGNSGGLAANGQGELIGVPSQLGTGDAQDSIVDCRALADTNRDGVINDEDQCVSTGGFINALRPITLALPLIEKAKAGEINIVQAPSADNYGEFQTEGDVILEDDFLDNRNNWALGGDENGSADIIDGQLVIDLDLDSYVQWSSLPDIYPNLMMVTEGEFINSVGDGEAGFICGLKDSMNFTVLEVSEDGYFTIWKYEDDEFISLVDWTFSDVIDLSQPFKLSAYCGADRLALALNDILLVEIEEKNFTPGRVGLMAGTWDNPGISVGYENFTIMVP
jgi:S1-C subfamily serine protease